MEKILELFWQEKWKADSEYNKTQNKYYEGVSDAMLYCINEIQHSAKTPVSGQLPLSEEEQINRIVDKNVKLFKKLRDEESGNLR